MEQEELLELALPGHCSASDGVIVHTLLSVEHVPVALRTADDLREVGLEGSLQLQKLVVQLVCGLGRLQSLAKLREVAPNARGCLFVGVKQEVQRLEEVFVVTRSALGHFVTER